MNTPHQNADRLKQAVLDDLAIYDTFHGRRVVMEEGAVGNDISVATLESHGSQTASFTNYCQFYNNLNDLYLHVKKPEQFQDPKLSPHLTLSRRAIFKSQIASIQLLEDILKKIKSEQIFNAEKT